MDIILARPDDPRLAKGLMLAEPTECRLLTDGTLWPADHPTPPSPFLKAPELVTQELPVAEIPQETPLEAPEASAVPELPSATLAEPEAPPAAPEPAEETPSDPTPAAPENPVSDDAAPLPEHPPVEEA